MSHDNLEVAGSILVVFNFCALNQTTESVQSVPVRAKWISARTPHGVRGLCSVCADWLWTPSDSAQSASDWLGSVGECKLLEICEIYKLTGSNAPVVKIPDFDTRFYNLGLVL